MTPVIVYPLPLPLLTLDPGPLILRHASGILMTGNVQLKDRPVQKNVQCLMHRACQHHDLATSHSKKTIKAIRSHAL